MIVSWNPVYAGVRMGVWWLIWIAVHVDAFINRQSRGRGWRLHRGILIFLTTQIAAQTIHVFVSFQDNSTIRLSHSDAFKAEVFFSWLTKSVFLSLILLVSAGYCILRDRLGSDLQKIAVIPIIYGVTSMTVDYILLHSYEQVVTQRIEEEDDEEHTTEDLQALLLVICLLMKAIAFVIAWVFVFEHLNGEIKELKGEKEQEPVGSENNEAEYTRPDMQNAADVNNDPESVDAPKTAADAIGDQAKLLLLSRFRKALIIYVVAIIVVNVLPLYIGHASIDTIQSVIVVLENVLLIGFVVAMAAIFRPAADNPYLLLVDDLDETGETKEVTTELGVLSFEPVTPQRSTTIVNDQQQTQRSHGPTFALADDDDLELTSPHASGPGDTTPMAASIQRLPEADDVP